MGFWNNNNDKMDRTFTPMFPPPPPSPKEYNEVRALLDQAEFWRNKGNRQLEAKLLKAATEYLEVQVKVVESCKIEIKGKDLRVT